MILEYIYLLIILLIFISQTIKFNKLNQNKIIHLNIQIVLFYNTIYLQDKNKRLKLEN